MTVFNLKKPIEPATAMAEARSEERSRFRAPSSETWTTIAVFVLSIVLILASRVISPAFGGWNMAQAILVLSSFVMIAGFGQGLVILLGGLDLSVASVMTFGGVLTFSWIGASGPALLWGIPAILLVTAFIGLVNGVGITFLRVPPFIMTLAVGIIVYSLCLGFTQGTPRGQASPILSALYTGRLLGIPIVIYFMLLAAIAGQLLQSRTPFGRKLYAIGTSDAAAYIAGIGVRRLTIATYALAGACSGLAGIMMVGYAGGATLTMGQPYLLPSIAAVVVGGTSILGGRGTYLGTVGGAILLTTISTIIGALQMAEGWRTVIYGAVILVALLLMREKLLASLERRVPRKAG
ncbi:MAG TPA: ABC transporter permease [Hypericibacter adhaerens]|jgi:ribose transport system permease protein|uniref:ABC transporter permease n=1 Tax=Hypericibacter adhaerens TaxID=2602016 RepID=UPI001CD94C2F|nr:ABC transporter permease [Hypericibacter adhaerens]HWA44444.1 ABC transporter permease [Hypericibacter adhaerens]